MLIAGQLIGDGGGHLGNGWKRQNNENASREIGPQHDTAAEHKAAVSNWLEHPR
jgi:hypothetical protein